MLRGITAAGRRSGALARSIVACLGCLLLARVSAAQCAGDCRADGEVTVDELVIAIGVALERTSVLACPVADANLDGRVTIDEIVAGVADAADGCRAPAVRRSFDFRSGRQGWEAGFADYAPEMVDTLELDAGLRSLPPELGLAGPGFLLSGANRSDDLFMFLKRQLTSADGIQPDQTYSVGYAIVFASAAPTGCAGIGGAPGESVYLKAGAAPVEPQALFDPLDNHVRMNVDKGNQASGGVDASVAGNVANGLPCEPGNEMFVSLHREHVHMPITASPEGEVWLLLGTDSGFEGTTTLYYQRIDVQLTPLAELSATALIAP